MRFAQLSVGLGNLHNVYVLRKLFASFAVFGCSAFIPGSAKYSSKRANGIKMR
jgi:hypothetical protein